MKYHSFTFELMSFHLNTDGEFEFIIGEWDTAGYSGDLFRLYRYYPGKWVFDFLCARTIYQIYLDWREK